MNIPIEVSARHVHLTRADIDRLFGKGYKLEVFKKLSQHGQFASQETLVLKTEKGEIAGVRIVGPERPQTQIELASTDAIRLGITPPLRISGDTFGAAPVSIIGPKGVIQHAKSAIIARRHIHASTDDAKKMGVIHGAIVSVLVEGDRGLRFDQVIVRVDSTYQLRLHLDTDEGNTIGYQTGMSATLLKE